MLRRMIPLSAFFALVLAMGAPAVAHHKSDHSKGPGAASESTMTEDTDPDGVPNDPDPLGDSDNQHPSGKDKHFEAGGSGNQGWAQSDPDGDTNGGQDKPGGTGGEDQWDQDGNNGCGNDDDFEDDNNGNCGGERQREAPEAGGQEEEKGGRVGRGVGGGGAEVHGQAVAQAAEVLGVSVARGEAGQLAVTGTELLPLALLAMALIASGGLVVLVSRRAIS